MMYDQILKQLDHPSFQPLESCKEKIRAWLTESGIADSDKAEIVQLIEDQNMEELNDRFYRDLEFGTGGMRGVMGMGYNRLNCYVLRRAIQGFSNYILMDPAVKPRGDIAAPRSDMAAMRGDRDSVSAKGVAISYDSRNNSRMFAENAAGVLAANGIEVFIFPSIETTPALSFAIRKLNCVGGLCITASHNPPKYNGIKMYWQDGAQVVAPQDSGILKEVLAISNLSSVKFIPFEEALKRNRIHFIGEDVSSSYFEAIQKLSLFKNLKRDMKIVYTPLHGTGKIPVLRALKTCGFQNAFVVPEQAEPNGDFPTVKRPNPEEPEALSLAIQYAKKCDAHVVFATDPDSDRLAVAVYCPAFAQGPMKHQSYMDFVLFNGNQIGALLIEFMLSTMQSQGKLKSSHKIIKTIVTSELHAHICKHYNVEIFNTLTGFKWIAGLVRQWEEQNKQDYEYLFGTEESFGFMPANGVRDKDAVAALCQAAEMICFLNEHKKTACDYLFEIFKQYGAWQEDLINVELYGESGLKRIHRIMDAARKNPPRVWNQTQVVETFDFKQKETYSQFGVPPSDVLQFILEDGSKISVRPSGTEPKLKIYLSVCTKGPDIAVAYGQTVEKIKKIRLEIDTFINSID